MPPQPLQTTNNIYVPLTESMLNEIGLDDQFDEDGDDQEEKKNEDSTAPKDTSSSSIQRSRENLVQASATGKSQNIVHSHVSSPSLNTTDQEQPLPDVPLTSMDKVV